jgi:hypothetical protein
VQRGIEEQPPQVLPAVTAPFRDLGGVDVHANDPITERAFVA